MLAAAVAAHGGPEAADQSRLGTTEDSEALALGELDITTDSISLAGIETEIEAFADSEVLRAILDQGELLAGRGGGAAGVEVGTRAGGRARRHGG